MKISLALLLLAAMPAVAVAQVSSFQGYQLAPGETLVSVNGVPVQRHTSQPGVVQTGPRTVVRQGAANYQTPVASVSLAQSKANRMARSNFTGHLGGGFGAGHAEGVGWGSTREAAIRNCCYWGQRTPIDIGAATNGSRWFACVIYR